MKLIAEPWDVGPGRLSGRQLSRALGGVERQVPRRGAHVLARRRGHGAGARVAPRRIERHLSSRAAAASYASINFVTAHDGYTLHDLVSYEQKHNEANGENNQRRPQRQHQPQLGRRRARPTIRTIIDMRFRVMRDFLATLAFSQGVPMLSHGDEIARTQRGNNNAYAQDNEITWVNWDLDDRQQASCSAFTRKCSPCGRRTPCCGAGTSSAASRRWKAPSERTSPGFAPDGKEMTRRRLAQRRHHALRHADRRRWRRTRSTTAGRPFGRHAAASPERRRRAGTFTLPTLGEMKIWVVMVDTAKHELPVVRRGRVDGRSAHADAAALRRGPPHRDERRRPARSADAEGATHTMSDR